MEAGQSRRKPIQAHPLAAHAGVDFQMHGERTSAKARLVRSAFQFVQLPRLPGHGGQVVTHNSLSLAGKNAANHQNPRLGAERAGGYTLLDAANAQPACAGAHHSRSANAERVAIGVGLDDGQQLRMGRGQGREKPVVVFQEAGVNLNPAGAHWHWEVQASV